MAFRRALLVSMLIALAVAAGLGVMAVLFGAREDVIFQALGLAVLTGVACGALLLIGWISDKIKNPNVGVVGAVLILVEFLMIAAITLGLERIFGMSRSEDSLAGDIFALIFATVPALLLVAMLRYPRQRLAAIVGLVGCGAFCAAIFLAGTVASFIARDRMYGSAATFPMLTPVLVACLINLDRPDRRRWRWIGVAAALSAFAIGLRQIWTSASDISTFMIFFGGLSVVIAHANLAILTPLKPGQRWLMWAAIGAVVGTAIMLDLTVWTKAGATEFYGRVAAAFGICAGCGSVALVVLWRANRKIAAPPVAPKDISQIDLICPHCQRRQTMVLGGGSCVGCGLKINVNIEEPRCANCGYLLYMLSSDRCPECGTPVGVETGKIENRPFQIEN